MAPQTTVTELPRPDAVNTSDPLEPEAKITRVKHVASYSWLDKATKPTISVPGFPPIWTPPSVPQRLQPDVGLAYIDRNAALNPQSPLEPLFRAVAAEKPGFALRDVDLVTDRNGLRKLLRFVRASSRDRFRIRVDMAGPKTVLFSRDEPRATEMMAGFRGYGNNFEKTYTKTEGHGAGYHRIVSYDFAGLRCLVRHETDGCIDIDNDKSTRLARVPQSVDELASGLEGLSIPKSKPDDCKTAGPSKTTPLVVKTGGRVMDISSTLEIKTKTATSQLDMTETLAQLWIAQTPNLVAAYHLKGIFVDVGLRDATDEIRRWEVTNKDCLCGLARLLKDIIRLVKDSPSRKAVVEYDGGEKLRVVAGQGTPVLPDDLYVMWEEKKVGEKGFSE